MLSIAGQTVPFRVIFFVAAAGFMAFESVTHSFVPVPEFRVQDKDGKGKIYKEVLVLAANGETLCQTGINQQELSSISEFSPYLRQAVIASEDNKFDWHLGIEPSAIARAVFKKLSKGEDQGGSTITQQVARTLYLNRLGGDSNLLEKVKEGFSATALELFYSKDEILKMYLNRVFVGNDNYGFEAASRSYFRRPSNFLNVEQAANLVSIVPAPNRYNQYDASNTRQTEKARERRNRVLKNMASLGFISNKERDENSELPPSIADIRNTLTSYSKKVSPAFCNYILNDELGEVFGGNTNLKLIIETSLDVDAQQQAERLLASSVRTDGRLKNYSQGAILSLKLNSGEITSMVGGVDNGFNRTMSYLQPASTFKIFTYIAALEQGIPLETILSYDNLIWQTKLFNREGEPQTGCERAGGARSLNLRDGLIRSENVISFRLAQKVKLTSVVNAACNLGIEFQQRIPEQDKAAADKAKENLEVNGKLALLVWLWQFSIK